MNDMRSALKAGFQGMQGKQNHGKPPVEQQNRPALQSDKLTNSISRSGRKISGIWARI